jgi:hypothetical protein
MKASLNGPNRRKNRSGNKTVVSDFSHSNTRSRHVVSVVSSSPEESSIDLKQQCKKISASTTKPLKFKVKSLEHLLNNNNASSLSINKDCLGDACVFTVVGNNKESRSNTNYQCSGQELIEQHFHMSTYHESKLNIIVFTKK